MTFDEWWTRTGQDLADKEYRLGGDLIRCFAHEVWVCAMDDTAKDVIATMGLRFSDLLSGPSAEQPVAGGHQQ